MYRSARLIASFVRGRFLCLVGVSSSPDEGAGVEVGLEKIVYACSSERITWVHTQKDKLKVIASSLTYDFLERLVLPGSGTLSG